MRMTVTRGFMIFVLTIAMCGFSGMVAMRKLSQADPADVFESMEAQMKAIFAESNSDRLDDCDSANHDLDEGKIEPNDPAISIRTLDFSYNESGRKTGAFRH